LIIPFVIYWILPQEEVSAAGNVLGINAGFIILTLKGLPQDTGRHIQKILRIVSALGIYYITDFVFKSLGWDDISILNFIRSAIVSFTVIYGTTRLSVKLDLYKRVNSAQ
jgi:multisubunit Na+/H+ antiporter MnhE subunit